MATTKINAQFIISDSSVNRYGMRLMTDGYQIHEFLKSPIGYYMHDVNDGVLLKWDNVHVDGDKIIGTPVINMEHPRATRTVTEIEEGFLNAASVGKLVILDYHLDNNDTDPENPIIVVTNWYNKECSIVDRPGNRNAMKVEIELCDGDNNIINLSDLFKNNKMKKVTLEMTPELMGFLSLSDEDTTATAVADGIKNLYRENSKLSGDLQTERERGAKEKIAQILDKGLSEGRFNKATRDKLEKQFAGKPKELAELISDMPKYESLTDRLVDGDLPRDLADKNYDELHRAGKIVMVKEKFPARYRELYKAKFGVEPK